MAQISFRAKVETLRYVDNTVASVRIKVPELKRSHCDMAAFRVHPKYGSYANSDLFPAILKRIRAEKFGGDYLKMDRIPEGVSVDQSGFLATVTVDV